MYHRSLCLKQTDSDSLTPKCFLSIGQRQRETRYPWLNKLFSHDATNMDSKSVQCGACVV